MKMSMTDQRDTVRAGMRLVLEHNDQQLEWDVSDFTKKSFDPEMELFKHINQFWESLSSLRQEKIWHLYTQIYESLQQTTDPIPLIQMLQPLIAALYDEHPIEEIDRWIAFNTHLHNIHIPSRFEEEYVYSDEKPGNREKTYTRQDYVRLVGLALTMRPMIPIWGEFLSHTKRETGTNYKETYAYALLAKTKLNDCAAVEKLRVYIGNNLKADRSLASAIVAGVGSEDYVSWLLSTLIVNRICVGDIRGSEHLPCLVITSYKYIAPMISSNNGTGFGDPIRNKEFSTGDGDQEPSRLEGFKVKAEHAQGEISPFEIYLWEDNYRQAAKRLYPKIDIALLEELVATNQVLRTEQIHECQIALMQWVLAPVVSPRAGDYLQKHISITGLSIAQAVLWQTGHRKLAMLITAISTMGNAVHQISGLGSMARLTREQTELLLQYYPYSRIPFAKPNTKVVNPAVKAIDIQAQGFSVCDWLITAPDRLFKEVTANRRYGCPHDIKQILAALAIDIVERKWLTE